MIDALNLESTEKAEQVFSDTLAELLSEDEAGLRKKIPELGELLDSFSAIEQEIQNIKKVLIVKKNG